MQDQSIVILCNIIAIQYYWTQSCTESQKLYQRKQHHHALTQTITNIETITQLPTIIKEQSKQNTLKSNTNNATSNQLQHSQEDIHHNDT